MTIISDRCDLREFCESIDSTDIMEIIDSISIEISAHHRQYREATGEWELPECSRQWQYCEDLQALLSVFMNGRFSDDRRPGLVRDALPLFREILKVIRFSGNVQDLVDEAIAEERCDTQAQMVQFAEITDIHAIIVSKDEVLAGDTSATIDMLNRLTCTPDTARAYRERVDLGFHGYDDDTRELFEIQEVRDYVRALDNAFPYWLFFLSKQYLGLQCVLLCLLLPFLNDTGKARVFPQQIGELLDRRWFPAMNQVSVYAGLDEDEIERLTDRAVEYITNGRRSFIG